VRNVCVQRTKAEYSERIVSLVIEENIQMNKRYDESQSAITLSICQKKNEEATAKGCIASRYEDE
jgi:hypothetical protein